MTDTSQPIIVIGAGRSGSTLLNRLLGAHPDIFMFGELNQVVSTLWQRFWTAEPVAVERNALLDAQLGRDHDAVSRGVLSDALQNASAAEHARIGAIIRDAVAALLKVEEKAHHLWGFQEIWVSGSGKAVWEGHDAAFPDAQYLHIVRHPLDFARSLADWHRTALDAAELGVNLGKWVAYRAANAARRDTGRYTRVRYEDLSSDPGAALRGFHAKLGLPDAADYREALGTRTKSSGFRSAVPDQCEAIMAEVPGLLAALEEDGYDRLRPDLMVGSDARPAASHASDDEWVLNPPFLHDGGEAWVSKIYAVPRLLDFAGVPDTDDAPKASRLILLEDGEALGPAHGLHASIRAVGRGLYSFWGEQPTLHFSTSDNTDPNTNGRRYSLLVR